MLKPSYATRAKTKVEKQVSDYNFLPTPKTDFSCGCIKRKDKEIRSFFI